MYLEVIIGLCVGFISALIGIGGGSIYVVILFFIFGLPIHDAISTSIFVAFFSTLSTYAFYMKHGNVQYRVALALESATVPGVFIGTYATAYLPREPLELIYSIVLILVSANMLFSAIKHRTVDEENGETYHIREKRFLVALLVSFLAGLLAGSLGISGGVLKVPMLNLVLAMPIKIAVATSSFMILLTSTAAVAAHALYGQIAYDIGIWMSIGAIIGAQAGGRYHVRVSPFRVKAVLGFVLLFAALRMLYGAIT